MAHGKVDDISTLENLTEATMLEELRARYNDDNIYTYVGEIVCAVNPFKWIPSLYAPDLMDEYTNIGLKSNKPPHLYALADLSFHDMLESGKPQVCVISGESGAGKTECAKLFVKQLVHVARGAEFEGLEERLIQVNPLLEASGNAKTGMNNNSSRFGKFISIRFNKTGAIKGAVMTDYILEKSRVVAQGPMEQNFHIFYLFLLVSPTKLKKNTKLTTLTTIVT
jgi:myosin heavy subunit